MGRYLAAFCDDCGTRAKDAPKVSSEGRFAPADELIRWLTDHGWTREGIRDFCPTCTALRNAQVRGNIPIRESAARSL